MRQQQIQGTVSTTLVSSKLSNIISLDGNYQEHLSPAPTSAAQSGPSQEELSAREEEELAMALSLSLAEMQGVNNVLNSDDESDAEPTPPSSPYMGTLKMLKWQ